MIKNLKGLRNILKLVGFNEKMTVGEMLDKIDNGEIYKNLLDMGIDLINKEMDGKYIIIRADEGILVDVVNEFNKYFDNVIGVSKKVEIETVNKGELKDFIKEEVKG